jgi:serine/threonine protein kinase
MALEWLRGHTLDALLSQRRADGQTTLEPKEALALLKPVIEAVAFGHRLGVVHRDLKPANIFVCEYSGPPVACPHRCGTWGDLGTRVRCGDLWAPASGRQALDPFVKMRTCRSQRFDSGPLQRGRPVQPLPVCRERLLQSFRRGRLAAIVDPFGTAVLVSHRVQ